MRPTRGTLLVIEDHSDLRRALMGILESFGFEVPTAEDAAQGLIKARETRPDLIFCDLKFNGLCSQLKAEFPRIKLILTGTESTGRDVYGNLACYSLANPISAPELLAALKHCLGQSFAEPETFRSLSARSKATPG